MQHQDDDFFEVYADANLESSGSLRSNFGSDLEEEDDNIDEFKWSDGEFIPEPLLFRPHQTGFDASVIESAADITLFCVFWSFLIRI